MAKKLKDLELVIDLLEAKKKKIAEAMKSEVDLLQESIKPVNLIKSALSDLVSNKNTQSIIMSSAAGMAGSMLLGRKGNILGTLLAQLAENPKVRAFIENEKPKISELIEKVKSFFSKKSDSSFNDGKEI